MQIVPDLWVRFGEAEQDNPCENQHKLAVLLHGKARLDQCLTAG
jgi:hypothetical protein